MDKKHDSVLGEKIEHPSYGTIQCSRVSGHAPLFDSALNHQHFIAVRIGAASVWRNLNQYWIHGSTREYIEVRMSEAQWAAFVASTNVGSGVPCTLKYVNGEQIPDPPRIDQHELHLDELKADLSALRETLTTLRKEWDAIADKPSINKADRKVFAEAIRRAEMKVDSGIPFAADQFKEAMEKTVIAAKVEVEAHVVGVIQRTGLEALRKMAPQLDGPDDAKALPEVTA